ncbi:hypothetical protein AB4Z48_03185 [Cupriavidus sp. 2TAF22]|uniref:hypothetical protein n=1 Tax=unclassified Cupriavidus TaxID=2640874 RepID=UPI003F90FD8F
MQGYRSDPTESAEPVIPAVTPARVMAPAGAPEAQLLDLETSRMLRFYAKAGTTLYLMEGELELSGPPRWLADTIWRQPQRLAAGSSVTLPAGWVEVLARRAATLRLYRPAAQPWRARWLGLAARFRAAASPAAPQCIHGEQQK